MSWHVGSWDELVELREELVVEGLGTHAINVLDPLVMIGERAGHVVDRAVEGGWGAMELKTNVSRIRVRFTRQRLRINEL